MNYEYCNGHTHTIKRGDTLYALSRRYRVPLEVLLRANPYVDVYNLQPGDTLCIPVKQAEGCRFCLDPFIQGGKMTAPDNGEASDDRQPTMEPQMGILSASPVENLDTTVPNGASDSQWTDLKDTQLDKGNKQDCNAVDKQGQCKLVSEQGETMATLLEKTDMGIEEFFKKNSCKDVALLPGIVYKK